MEDKYLLVEKADVIGKCIKNIQDISNALINADVIPSGEEMWKSPLVDAALNSDFNSLEELDVKKAMAAVIILAKKKGVVPAGFPTDFDGIKAASIVDDAFTRIKVAYQNSIGNIDVMKGADMLVDRAAARVMAVADVVVAKGLDFGINKLSVVVANIYPPALPVVYVIKAFQPVITKKAQELVRKGISKLSDYAKQAIRKAGNYVRETVSNKIKKLLFS